MSEQTSADNDDTSAPPLLTENLLADRHLFDCKLGVFAKHFVDQRSVVQRPVDQSSVDQMTVDQMTVDQRSVDQSSVDQMTVDQMSVG